MLREAMLLDQSILEALPSEGRALSGYLRGFGDCVERRGARARELLDPYGLTVAALEQPGEALLCRTVVSLLEDSSRKTNDTLFGYHLAEIQEPDVFGPAIPLARAAPSFGSAIEQLITYMPYTHSREGHMELLVGRKVTELRWFSPVELEYCEQAYYHHLFILLKTLAMLAGDRFAPEQVGVRCAASLDDVATMSQATRCPVRPRSSANLIAFETDLLQAPLRTSNRIAFTILQSALDAAVQASSESILDKVRSYVLQSLSSGRCSIEDCAAELETSSRTLQKRLAEAGRSFSELVESVTIQKAKERLTATSRLINEIAFELGYSEHSCFTRAFKRSTGLTPEEYRRRHAHLRRVADAPWAAN